MRSTDNVGFGVTQTGLPSWELGQDTSLRTSRGCGVTEVGTKVVAGMTEEAIRR